MTSFLTKNYTVSPDVLSQEVDGETVLLDMQGESYFGLNKVGTRVWQLLQQQQKSLQIYDTIQKEYNVGADQLKNDIQLILEDLLQEGLIVPQADK